MNSFGPFLEELNKPDFEKRLAELEAKVTQQARTIVGLQNELIRAGRYDHDDPIKKIQGIQILLTKAGEYKGRKQRQRG
jgi:uncharacterized coiled-coil protein SlyX